MRRIIASLLACTVAFGLWQRTELGYLRETENAHFAAAGRFPSEVKAESTMPADLPAIQGRPPLSDAELVAFTHDLLARRADFTLKRSTKTNDALLEDDVLCDTLRRSDSGQLQTLLNAMGYEVVTTDEKPADGVHGFLYFSGLVNPQATLELLFKLRNEQGHKSIQRLGEHTAKSWFQQDPAGLVEWAHKNGFPDGKRDEFGGACERWAAAAVVVGEPSPENLSKLSISYLWPQLAATSGMLPNQEARLAFFKSLHVVTRGVSDEIGPAVWPLAAKLTFTQIAQIADATPAFRPSVEGKKDSMTGKSYPLGSLRYMVALNARNGTASQRLNWLIARPEDQPTSTQFDHLIKTWCSRDYPDVAEWAKTLPPGAERDTVRKAILGFVKYEQGMRPSSSRLKTIAAEWESP